ncbi:alpha/beta-hydrolase [Microthyrium microscopicum]|uniref:Alpha/beta-hydrolase n=1 Tax=Microthyrium microscopicum TaxID=703497 RepID=A0A6A6UTS4_9PEZI|nr:alpha/beta-hydrolase [Microthyrium microscopicum]
MAEIQDAKYEQLGLSKTVSQVGGINAYHRNLDKISSTNPLLVLIHGYPQSAYEWRLMIPLLPAEIPLFCPDLPGYGQSKAMSEQHTKLDFGITILEALRSILPGNQIVPLILIGHDRGARIAHRLQVSSSAGEPQLKELNLNIIGIALLDILPTKLMWSLGSEAAVQVGSFHWAFLANVELAMEMLQAYGGGKWAQKLIMRWAGSNEKRLDKLKSGDAMDVYGSFFDKKSVLRASCEDYKAGASLDVTAQGEDQDNRRLIDAPVLLLYGKEYLGAKANVKVLDAWIDWVKDQSLITEIAIQDGVGHFVAEEAAEETAEALLNWIETIQGKVA